MVTKELRNFFRTRVLVRYPRIRRVLRSLRRALTPPHAHGSSTQLLARTDEFNRNAESHWVFLAADDAGRAHVLSKPLNNPREAARTLYRVGLALDALRPGLGHIVVDLGAGSCWLSAWLARLGCRTVSVDVSVAALRLGRKRLLSEPHRNPALEPAFLPYDGHSLPLRDASVERVLCFDSFHHVPNQDEVLAEIFRVLRPGGRAVFAEPGEAHSHAEHSVLEGTRFGVLENDIDLRELAARARRIGFSRLLLKPYPEVAAITFGEHEYFEFMDGRDAFFPLDVVRQSLKDSFNIFVLLKGEPVLDSREPGILRAEIIPARDHIEGPARSNVSLSMRVSNTGDTRWLHRESSVGGWVHLSGQLLHDDGRPITLGYCGASLPQTVEPGEAVELALDLTLPEAPGPYRLRLDMVDDKLLWFAEAGSPTPTVLLNVGPPDSRRPGVLQVDLVTLEAPAERAQPSQPLRLRVRALNTGDTTWLRAVGVGTVALGGQLQTADGVLRERDYFRAALPRDVAPGESVEIPSSFLAPTDPGRFRVKVGLVAEGLIWFEEAGSMTLSFLLEVAGLSKVPGDRMESRGSPS